MLGRAALATLLVLSLACSKKEAEPSAPKDEVEKQDGDEAKAGSATPVAPAKAEPPAAKAEPPAAKAEPPARFKGNGFSVPIPEHYSAVKDDVRSYLSKQIGQEVDAVLVKDTRDGGFRSSIVVTKIASNEVNPGDVKTCEVAAEQMGKAVGTKVQGAAKAVSYGYGKSCQFEMGDDSQHAIQTIVYVGKTYWTMTCNASPKALDTSRKECEQALAGFGP